MTGDEARARLQSDLDFVYLPKFEFSLQKLMERYPDGVPDRLIAQALMLTEDDVEEMFQSAVLKLRKMMKVS